MTVSGVYRNELLDVIVEAIPFLVAEIESGVILFASRPLEAMFGVDMRGGLQGTPLELLMPEDARARHVEFRRAYSANPVSRPIGAGHTFQALHRDGHIFRVEIGLYPAVLCNQPCVIATVLDASVSRHNHDGEATV